MRNFVLLSLFIASVAFTAGAALVRADAAVPETAVIAAADGASLRIMVQGQEIAVIDGTGLYVRGDVAYTGTITDGLPPRLKAEGRDAR